MKTALTVAALVIGIIAGFFIGRQFPEHHYVSWHNSLLLYDTTTGKVCDPTPTPAKDKAFPDCGS